MAALLTTQSMRSQRSVGSPQRQQQGGPAMCFLGIRRKALMVFVLVSWRDGSCGTHPFIVASGELLHSFSPSRSMHLGRATGSIQWSKAAPRSACTKPFASARNA